MDEELEKLIRLFEVAADIVEKSLLRAVARGAGGASTASRKSRRKAEIASVLAELRSKAIGTADTPGQAWEVVSSAYRQGSDDALGGIRRAGGEPVNTSFGDIHTGAAKEVYDQLVGRLDGAIAFIDRRTTAVFRKMVLSEILVSQLAGRNRADTAGAIEKNLSEAGLKAFRDRAGKEWSLDKYAKTVASEASHEALTIATINRAAENGFDLVKISEHPNSCKVCKKYEGKVYSISGTSEKRPPLEEAPPYHPNCLLPGQFVAAPNLVSTSKRWYEGEVLVIDTADGNRLSCTPNHPVLTGRGWVAAGLLDEGTDELYTAVHEGAVKSVDPDYDDVPALIEDVVDSFGMSGNVASRSVPVAAEDFHGDGLGSEICIVGADSLLWDCADAMRGELAHDGLLGGADVGDVADGVGSPLSRLGALHKLLGGSLLASHGVVGSGSERTALGFRHPGKAEAHSVGSGTGQAVLAKPSLNGERRCNSAHGRDFGAGTVFFDVESMEGFRAGVMALCGSSDRPNVSETNTSIPGPLFKDSLAHTEGVGNLLNRLAGTVKLNHVIKVKRRNYSGHVYNLQTEQGWYVGNNIITHNCRHVLMPYVEMGAGSLA